MLYQIKISSGATENLEVFDDGTGRVNSGSKKFPISYPVEKWEVEEWLFDAENDPSVVKFKKAKA